MNGALFVGQLDAVHSLKFFDPALHLLGLSGLIAKAVDENFELLNALALVAVGCFQLFEALRFLREELFVVAGVELNALVPDLGNLVYGHVQKVAVVRNQNEGVRIFAQIFFQPVAGFKIKMVGGLIKLLAGEEKLSSGEYKFGHNVQSDYFAQDQYKELSANARIIEDLGTVSPQSTETELRNLLGCFLFSGEEAFKKIGVLSGGERNRYALLRMLLHPANFLLLDEPTNHLDMRAKDVLLAALSKYTGTVVFVSHDRYFIDKLATRVFEIGEGRVEVYPGNYEDYRWRKEGGAEKLQEVVHAFLPVASGNGHSATPAASAGNRRLNPLKRKQMEERVQELEAEISQLESDIAACQSSLLQFVSSEETQRLTYELGEHKQQLQKTMAEWEALGQALQV